MQSLGEKDISCFERFALAIDKGGWGEGEMGTILGQVQEEEVSDFDPSKYFDTLYCG